MALQNHGGFSSEGMEDSGILLELLHCLHAVATPYKGLVEKEVSSPFLLVHFVCLLHLAEVPEDPVCPSQLAIVLHLWAKKACKRDTTAADGTGLSGVKVLLHRTGVEEGSLVHRRCIQKVQVLAHIPANLLGGMFPPVAPSPCFEVAVEVIQELAPLMEASTEARRARGAEGSRVSRRPGVRGSSRNLSRLTGGRSNCRGLSWSPSGRGSSQGLSRLPRGQGCS